MIYSYYVGIPIGSDTAYIGYCAGAPGQPTGRARGRDHLVRHI